MLTLYTATDGSKTLLHTALNETYHSRHGAIAESLHVFLRAGLHDWLKENPHHQGTIHILEIGFGTGLNALLTLQSTLQQNFSVHYVALETFPLPYEQILPLGYVESIEAKLEPYFEAMHQAEWNRATPITPNFILEKKQIPLQNFESQEIFEVVYFDAFAPNVQPEMWQIAQLQRTTNAMRKGAFWVTYSAKGQLRRDLKTLGLQVEKLPAHPAKEK